MTRKKQLHSCLSKAFPDSHIDIQHPRGDDYHLKLTIISSQFSEKTRLQRHQMVYAALGDLIESGRLHALSIDARCPSH